MYVRAMLKHVTGTLTYVCMHVSANICVCMYVCMVWYCMHLSYFITLYYINI